MSPQPTQTAKGWRPAARPEWVRQVNALGEDLAASGVNVLSLAVEHLLAQARQRTGFFDFGDDTFLEGLTRLVWSLEREAALTLTGRIIARDEILNGLECRLWVEEAFRREPEIAQEKIRAPILIGGAGRSGTTLLHELLAQDPNHRAPLAWEVRDPYPPAHTEEERTERIERADHELKLWHRVTPEVDAIHPWGARLPQECTFFMAHSFSFGSYCWMFHVPTYAQWLAHCDMDPAYRYHRRFLQVLQHQAPGKRWVLKQPGYIDLAEMLLRHYPDSCFLHTHRDPLRCIPSMASFVGTLNWQRSDRRFEVHRFSEQLSATFGQRLDYVKRLQHEGVFHARNYRDVLYAELVAKPLACVEGIYAHFDMEFSNDARQRMEAWLAARSQTKQRPGGHRYRFEDTQLDRDAERCRHKAYQEYFEVPTETSAPSAQALEYSPGTIFSKRLSSGGKHDEEGE